LRVQIRALLLAVILIINPERIRLERENRGEVELRKNERQKNARHQARVLRSLNRLNYSLISAL
jgi:hypothetical protein